MSPGRRMFGGDPVGLCAHCRHARQVPTPNAIYWMCERSLTDPRYEKYPRLPMIMCEGFESTGERGEGDEREEEGGSG